MDATEHLKEHVWEHPREYGGHSPDGDCYSKHIGVPDLERLAEEIPLATPDDFIVRAPGQHPGGSFYWVDFYPTVYVPVYEAEAEE